MESFVKIAKSFNIIFPKYSILDLWQGSEYTHLSISTHLIVLYEAYSES